MRIIISKLLTLLSITCCLFLSACGMENGGGTTQEQLLSYAIDALNKKEQFAFTGSTEIVSSGVTVQTDKRFEGYVVGGNQLFVKELLGTETAKGNVTQAGTKSGGPVLTFTRTNEQWTAASGQAGVESEKYKVWNPVSKLQELESILSKTVRYDHEQAKQPNEHVLQIGVPDKEMTALVASNLKAQQSQLSLERQLELARSKGLNDAQLSRMTQELEQVIKRSETSLQAMLDTLQAQGTYRLWVDRTTRLPRRLTTETTMSYSQDGANREETVRFEFEFTDYDKKTAIPQESS